MEIVTLNGSPGERSRSRRLLDYVHAALDARDLPWTSVVIRNLPAQALLHADRSNPELLAALAAVANAKVVVLASPIYQAAYSGLLKCFLDLVPQRGFEDKLVWPIGSGGSARHTLALDYALRPVLGAMGAEYLIQPAFAEEKDIQMDAPADQVLQGSAAEYFDQGITRIASHLGVAPGLGVDA